MPTATLRHSVTQPQRAFIENASRTTAFIGGVGSGKTRASILKTLTQPPGTVGMLIAPTFTMLKDSVLRTFIDVAKPLITRFNQSDLNARLINGTEILFRSADNPDRLRGPNLNWAGLDEAALMDRETLDIMLGRLRLEPGNLWFTTTPRGRSHWLYEYIQNGGAQVTTARTMDNPYLPNAFLDELKRQYTAAFYRQEVLGEFVQLAGTIFQSPTFYDALPDGGFREGHGFDAAYTARTNADYTVTVTGRLYGDRIYVTNMLRDQLEPAKYIARMKALGITNVTWMLSGTEKGLAAFLKDQGIKVQEVRASGDKYARAQPAAAAWNNQQILLPTGDRPWVQDLISEVCDFTGEKDAHDDIVDALSALHHALLKPTQMDLSQLRKLSGVAR